MKPLVIPGSAAMVGKVRRAWEIKPASKPHSTKKGKKGYDRKINRAALRDIHREY